MAVSAVDITKNLSGIDFPANKEDLINHARKHKANDELINILQQMPQREYGNMADVEKGFGEVK